MPFVKKDAYNKLKETEKILENQKTTSGLQIFGGQISQDLLDNSDHTAVITDIVKMRNGDSVSSASLEILKLPIINNDYEFYIDEFADDKTVECKEYLEYTYDNLFDTFQSFKKHLLLALDFGSSWFEKVWQYGATYNGKKTNQLVRLNPFMITQIFKYYYDDFGNFKGINFIKSVPESGPQYIDIDKQDLFYYAHDIEFGDVRGRSILRPNRTAANLKLKVMNADAKHAERGAGIPKGTIFGKNMTDEKYTKFASMLQNVTANSLNSYIVDYKDVAEVSLLEVQNQNNNIERLRYYDSQAFYNTLSQFMSSGISTAYGSRSTAETLQTPYELKIKAVKTDIENCINELSWEIIQNSYLYPIDKQAMPVFKFKETSQTDITAVTNAIINSARANGVKLTPDDEVWLRDMFGMPSRDIEEIKKERSGTADSNFQASAALYVPLLQAGIITPSEMRKMLKLDTGETFVPTPISIDVTKTAEVKKEVSPDQTQEIKTEEKTLENKPCCDQHKKKELEINKDDYNFSKMSEKCKSVFEFESAISTINETQKQAEIVINDIYGKIVRDVAKQLEKNPKRIPEKRFQGEFIQKLSNLYSKAKRQGIIDVNRELQKISTEEKKNEFQSENIVNVSVSKRLQLKISAIYDSLYNQIRDDMARQTQQSIESSGGTYRYITEKYLNSNVQQRSKLAAFTGGGYTDGTLDELNKKSKYIDYYEYTAIMDRLVCVECAPLDGMQFTEQECVDIGLNFKGGEQVVNPKCLGGDSCRCALIPITLKDISVEDLQKIVIPETNVTGSEANETIPDLTRTAFEKGLDYSMQNLWFKNNANYQDGDYMILSPADLLGKYAGTGRIIKDSPDEKQEEITATEPIAMIKNGQTEVPTRKGVIVYTDKGFYIIPKAEG